MAAIHYIDGCDCEYCEMIRDRIRNQVAWTARKAGFTVCEISAQPLIDYALDRLDKLEARIDRNHAESEAREQRRRDYPELFAREDA